MFELLNTLDTFSSYSTAKNILFMMLLKKKKKLFVKILRRIRNIFCDKILRTCTLFYKWITLICLTVRTHVFVRVNRKSEQITLLNGGDITLTLNRGDTVWLTPNDVVYGNPTCNYHASRVFTPRIQVNVKSIDRVLSLWYTGLWVPIF